MMWLFALGCAQIAIEDQPPNGTSGEDLALVTGPVPDQASEDTRCWTVGGQDHHMVLYEADLSAGTWSEVGRYAEGEEPFPNAVGLARVGDHLIMGLAGQTTSHWLDVDVASGDYYFGDSDDPSKAVFSDGQRLFSYSRNAFPAEICEFSDFSTLEQDLPTQCGPGPSVFQVGWAGDLGLVSAWHSTDRVEYTDMLTGETYGETVLEGWDTWVLGVSVAGDNVYVIDDGRNADVGDLARLAGFNIATGARIGEVLLPRSDNGSTPGGLVCFAP